MAAGFLFTREAGARSITAATARFRLLSVIRFWVTRPCLYRTLPVCFWFLISEECFIGIVVYWSRLLTLDMIVTGCSSDYFLTVTVTLLN